MDSYFPFTDLPHIMPMMDSRQTHIWDSSMSTDNPFAAYDTHFPFPPSLEPKPHEIQKQWRTNEITPSLERHSSDITTMVYGNSMSPWNSGLSDTSISQSPCSNTGGNLSTLDCYRSPALQPDDSFIFDADPSVYPFPAPCLLEAQPDRHSYFERETPSPSYHSEHNHSPEKTSSIDRSSISRFPHAKLGVPTTSRARRPIERHAKLASGRHRRRGAPGLPNDKSPTFVCSFAPYGCQSTFISKNEWKRHVTSKHLLLGFYRCDVGKCSLSRLKSNIRLPHPGTTPQPGQPNDFNRKDLFTQHHRRMHAPWIRPGRQVIPTESERDAFEAGLEDVRRRCWQGLRQPPMQSHCGFCKQTFSGPGSWDIRMEHVGRHFEREDPAHLKEEEEDLMLREWGLDEGILKFVKGRCRLVSLGC